MRLILGLLAGIALCLLIRGARADCPEWAEMVDRFEQTDPQDRRGTLAEWLALTKGSIEAQRTVMRAANWVEAGKSGADAWAECTSI